MMGQVLAFAPNFNAAKVSGARILRLMNRKPLIQSDESIVDDPNWVSLLSIVFRVTRSMDCLLTAYPKIFGDVAHQTENSNLESSWSLQSGRQKITDVLEWSNITVVRKVGVRSSLRSAGPR